MNKYLGNLQKVDIKIYEPNEAVKQILKQQESNKEVKLTPGRAMILYALYYYEALGEHTNLFVANKLAYFLQRLGETSLNRLKFEASHYGPYSVQVVHLLHNVNGKYLKGLEQMNVKAFETLELQYDKIGEVSDYVKKELTAEQRNRIKNLTHLIDGFQSAFALELLATVDFVKRDKPGITLDQVIETVHTWSERKRDIFKEKYLTIAFNHLHDYSDNLNFQ